MRRRLFTLASAASLVLFAATVVLWVVNLFVWTGATLHRPTSDRLHERWYSIEAVKGLIAIQTAYIEDEAGSIAANPEMATYLVTWTDPHGIVFGPPYWLHWYFYRESTERGIWVSIPDWMMMGVFVILPAARLGQSIARRTKRSKGVCTTCGYNLTGNTTGICPECGTAIAGIT